MYVYAIITVLFLSAFNVVMKLLPDRIHYSFTLPLITVGGLLTTLVGMLLLKTFSQEQTQATREGVMYALLMGLFWGLGQFASFHLFYKMPSLSVITPIIVGGIALTGVLTGYFIYKEPMSMVKVFGIASILIGVYLISKE